MRTLSRKTFFFTTRSRFRDATACSWVLRNRSIDRRLCVCVCEWKCERRVSYEEVSVFSKNVKKARFSRFRIYVVVQALGFMSASVLLPYITSLLRTANRVGEDSYCVARYCTHSGWSFSCATRTASLFQGALAVSRKYFKQSKWPYLAAFSHANSLY